MSKSSLHASTALTAMLSTALMLLFFWRVDRLYGEVTFAPLFGMIYLATLTLFFRPSTIAVCFALTLPYVIFSLRTAPSFDPGNQEHVIRLFIRSGTFALAGVIAVLAASFRYRAVDMMTQTKALLASLPVAILLSNAAGRVVWANPAAKVVLDRSFVEGRLLLEILPIDGVKPDYNLLFSCETTDQFVRDAIPTHQIAFVRLELGGQKLLATVTSQVRLASRSER
jgi:PAS domain-containing protein